MTIFDYLVAHPFAFIAATFAATAVNAALARLLDRAMKRQHFVAQENWSPPGALEFSKSRRTQAFFPFIGATFFSLAAILIDQAPFVEFFLGGFFLLQLLGFSFLVTNNLRYRLLANEAAAQGQITYSGWFTTRNFATQMLGGSTLALLGFVLTFSPALAGAALWGFATAGGGYRRARQATRTIQDKT